MIERLLLAAVSLAFIGVFAFTYLHVDRNRPAAFVPGVTDFAGAGRPFPDRGGRLSTVAVEPVPDVERASSSTSPAIGGEQARAFTICHTGGGTNCVVDGDTVWIDGEKIRVADIDAPETHPPRCEYEADLGNKATARLAQLLNVGPFELRIIDRDTDRYGRKLRAIMRDGRSLGGQLVTEGIARPWEGRRRPWC